MVRYLLVMLINAIRAKWVAYNHLIPDNRECKYTNCEYIKVLTNTVAAASSMYAYESSGLINI